MRNNLLLYPGKISYRPESWCMYNGWRVWFHCCHPPWSPWVLYLNFTDKWTVLVFSGSRAHRAYQPSIVLNNLIYSNEKEHAIHLWPCHLGVRQRPSQACQLNHLLTLWMGSFGTVSRCDYCFCHSGSFWAQWEPDILHMIFIKLNIICYSHT